MAGSAGVGGSSPLAGAGGIGAGGSGAAGDSGSSNGGGSGVAGAGAVSGAAGNGVSGAAGTSGLSGASGNGAAGNGAAGTSGAAGASGNGAAGASGSGASGAAGNSGAGGKGGTSGAGGSSGASGSAGTSGSAGMSGSAGSGGSGGCTAPAAGSTLVGWAAVSGSGVTTTTGGGNANPTTVTTLAQLKSAAGGTNAAVIWISGTITGSLSIGSNKTIAGLCGGQFHGHLDINNASNVIVRNLKIVGYGVGNCALDPSYDASVGCSSGNDAVTVQKSHHVWFDHDDISDGTDGNLDITNGANYVTVSWTKFHYTPRTDNSGSDSTGGAGHRYSNLVGGSDNNAGDVGNLNITWHHDWWADNVVERQPRVRYGKNHLFNNLWSSSAANYCVRAGMDAQILVESNVFTGVKNPQQFNSTADQGTSFITANGNVYTNTSGTKATGGGGTAFTSPPYSYTADATASLQAAIQSGAGPH